MHYMENQKTSLKLLMVGMGAIGGIAAAFIKKAGYEIQAVCKYDELKSQLETEGIHVSGFNGDLRITLPAVLSVTDIEEPKDIIFLAVKTTDLEAVVEQIRPILKEDSTVVAMENGITEDKLAEMLGSDKIVGCMVGFSATMLEMGHVELTSQGDLTIGRIDNQITPRLQVIRRNSLDHLTLPYLNQFLWISIFQINC